MAFIFRILPKKLTYLIAKNVQKILSWDEFLLPSKILFPEFGQFNLSNPPLSLRLTFERLSTHGVKN